MKANEFIREHGLQYTKSILEQFQKHTHVTNDGRMFIDENTCCNHIKHQLNGVVKMGDLKQLIESHELVEYSGGLVKAKRLLLAFYYKPLAQAILDVESCQ